MLVDCVFLDGVGLLGLLILLDCLIGMVFDWFELVNIGRGGFFCCVVVFWLFFFGFFLIINFFKFIFWVFFNSSLLVSFFLEGDRNFKCLVKGFNIYVIKVNFLFLVLEVIFVWMICFIFWIIGGFW